jgi:hypothetical protein
MNPARKTGQELPSKWQYRISRMLLMRRATKYLDAKLYTRIPIEVQSDACPVMVSRYPISYMEHESVALLTAQDHFFQVGPVFDMES